MIRSYTLSCDFLCTSAGSFLGFDSMLVWDRTTIYYQLELYLYLPTFSLIHYSLALLLTHNTLALRLYAVQSIEGYKYWKTDEANQ